MNKSTYIDGKKKYPEDIDGYWSKRKDIPIYQTTLDWVRRDFSAAQSAIEVGSFISPIMCLLDHIPYRIANDTADLPGWKDVEGVKYVKGDFNVVDWDPLLPDGQKKFDIAISHQTIEHVSDPRIFAGNLKRLSTAIICSTTFKVQRGLIKGHIHDPISLELFCSWFEPLFPMNILISSHPRMHEVFYILGLFVDKGWKQPVWMTSKWLEIHKSGAK